MKKKNKENPHDFKVFQVDPETTPDETPPDESQSETKTDVTEPVHEDGETLEHYMKWRDEVNRLTTEIDVTKEKRKEISNRIRLFTNELKEVITEGPEGMFHRPLLDLAEANDNPDKWRDVLVDRLDLSENLIVKISEAGYETVGQLVDWLNSPTRSNVKGIGAKAIEKIEEAVNKFHEPLFQKELEQTTDDQNVIEVNEEDIDEIIAEHDDENENDIEDDEIFDE